ncbi:PSD1 and planctomycete cytochrome C domain-containing protein [Tundrisphaera sp. TA3]|uniref:PSD1 and planctomycete cytochrome C domain-containing protein n=1 Tax=Tundrisphaera sp. TA3 TaxID=3435775 RepID=UPI003EBD95FE
MPIVHPILMIGLLAAGAGESPTPRVDFEREIRPILVESCLKCHGARKQQGGLSLLRKSTALAGGDGGPALIPGKPEESRLFRYIAGLEDDDRMPPEADGDALPAEKVERIRLWISQGAEWPDDGVAAGPTRSDHWAFRKPTRPVPPEVLDRRWPANPIDAFVLARLEREGIKPSPEADRTSLIRRVTLDLIGMPPTIAEVDAFVADDRPDAYQRVVDRLLASPHYGERWARRWLDAARYADTNGYEKDRARSIWPYRDWVIRALNEDLPFDRFTVEQLAGDLLPEASADQKVATGFHRNTMINEEGGIDVEEFRFASLVDRVATTGTVWLGLTIQCAQCHTHKFDPITQREYYQFLAFFNNADEPDLELPDPAIAAKRAEIAAEIRAREDALASRFPDRDTRVDWEILKPVSAHSRGGATLEIRPDASIVSGGESPGTDRYEVTFEADLDRVESLRLEALADPTSPSKGPGRAPNGNFVVSEFAASATPIDGGSDPTPIPFESATADHSQEGFAVAGAIDGDPETGWAVGGKGKKAKASIGKDHEATFRFARSMPMRGRSRITLRIDQNHGAKHTLGRFRIAAGRPHSPPTDDASVPIEQRRSAHLAVRFAEWERGLEVHRWTPVAPTSVVSAKNATMTVLADASVLATGDKPNNDTYRVELPIRDGGISAIRLEALPDPSLPDSGPGRAPLFSVGDFLLDEFEASLVPADGSPARPIAIGEATESFASANRSAALAIDGKSDTGWSIQGKTGQPHAAVFSFKEPLAAPGGTLVVTLHQRYIHQMTLGRFRLSTTAAPGPVHASGLPAEAEEIAATRPDERTPEQVAALRRQFLLTTPELKEEQAAISKLRAGMPSFTTSMVMQERDPKHARATQVRRRGEFLRPAETVEPGTLAVLNPLPSDAARDRLTLARWLVSEDNPLVGRVVMNRAWQAFFGRGLVGTVDDFGVRGEKPTHPELLDWLATEFPRRGWSQKAMHRLIVTSRTYRQDSRATPEATARDPRNELLARGPRFRVEAEAIRDIALCASGLLNPKIGGPSVYPPQPDGVTSLAYGQPSWPTSSGPDRYRRGLYTYIKRTAPFAAFMTLDAPSSELACVRRERSNTPLQALTLLNDPVFVEAAQALARRVLAEGPSDAEGRARLAFRLVLSRPPSADELDALVSFQARQADRFRKEELDPAKVVGDAGKAADAASLADLAAWTATARALLNLDEAITKE